jgi:hypothetical protein
MTEAPRPQAMVTYLRHPSIEAIRRDAMQLVLDAAYVQIAYAASFVSVAVGATEHFRLRLLV